jgi:ADP-heptose:LPS heptosyltransferase
MKKAELLLKRLCFAAARPLFAAPPRTGADADMSSEERARVRRVLVIRQDRRLGNLVLATSLLQALRRLLPSASIEVVAPHVFAPLLAAEPYVDRVIPVDHRHLISKPWRAAALRRRLRAPAPAELAIDASPPHHFSLSSGLLCSASGAPLRLGYDRGEARTFLNLLLPAPVSWEVPEYRLLHALTRALEHVPGDAPLPHLEVSAGERRALQHAFARWGLTERPVIGMHPGARPPKRWAVARFDEAARCLERQGFAVLVFWGGSERRMLEAMAPPGPRRIYAPPTDVRGFMTLVSGCSAFVSADCGPMHVAAALGVPCVALFRINNAVRYGPAGPQHRVLYESGDGAAVATVVDAVQAALETREADA